MMSKFPCISVRASPLISTTKMYRLLPELLLSSLDNRSAAFGKSELNPHELRHPMECATRPQDSHGARKETPSISSCDWGQPNEGRYRAHHLRSNIYYAGGGGGC